MLEKVLRSPASSAVTTAATFAKSILSSAAWSWSGPTPSQPSQARRSLTSAVKLSW